MPQIIDLNFPCLCKGAVMTPVPLLAAKGLITVRRCSPGWVLRCTMAVHPDRPHSAHPPLSPGLLGHVGTAGVKSSPMGALSSCWDISPGKKARICQQASGWSQCWSGMFSVRELSPKHSNRTTFGGGKRAEGHPFQGCVPSPWGKCSTHLFVVLKV